MFINGALIHKKFNVQKTTKLKKDIKPNVFDPRLGIRINSDNPALIFAEIINKSELISSDEEFWNKIKILADYSDENMKRKIYFDPKYRKLKRIKLKFHCPLFNTTLSGCNMTCNPCLALKYRNEMKVVNVKEEEFDVYIGRGTKWGNKFREGVDGTREEVIKLYKEEFLKSPWLFSDAIRELQGKILGCHCKPLPCHGDILIDFVQRGLHGSTNYRSNIKNVN